MLDVPATQESDTLTQPEQERLHSLESVVQASLSSFVECGLALGEINHSRLYRETNATFQGYVAERWGMGARQAYRLIQGAEVVESMRPLGHTDDSGDGLPPIFHESHARALQSVPEAERPQVWREANAEAPGRVTAKKVREVAERHHPKQGSANGSGVPMAPESEGSGMPTAVAETTGVDRPGPADDEFSPDLVSELERLVAENERLLEQVKALSTDDQGAEIVRLLGVVDRLQGRLNHEIAERQKERKEGEYNRDLLRQIRKKLNVANSSGILEALTGF